MAIKQRRRAHIQMIALPAMIFGGEREEPEDFD